MRSLAAKLLLRLDSSAKSGGVFYPTRSVWARQPCLLVVSISVCRTLTWLARSCNATKPKSQGPAHGR